MSRKFCTLIAHTATGRHTLRGCDPHQVGQRIHDIATDLRGRSAFELDHTQFYEVFHADITRVEVDFT